MTTGVALPSIIPQFLLNNGQLAVGGSLQFTVGGVPTAVFQDVGLTTPLPLPVPLNSRGEPSTAAGASVQVFLTPNTTYVVTLSDANGNQIWAATYVNGVQITASSLGLMLYPRTADEIAAGVTPVNYIYTPGDIRRYGASIDGVTDDTAAWSAALLSNFKIYFPIGISVVSTLSPRSGTLIEGFGPSSILKQKNSAEFINVITFNTKNGLTLLNFQINGNGAAQPAGEHKHGIDIEESTDVLVQGVTIHDCQGDAVYIASATDPVSTARVTVRDCTIYNLGRQGITIAGHGARNVVIENNHVRVGNYVSVSTSHGNCIHFEQDSVPVNYVGDIVVQGNICNDTGISCSGNFSGLSIIGNTIRKPIYAGSPWGIGLVNPANFVVSGNTIIGDNATVIDGIYVQDSGPGGAPSVKNFTISGNTIDSVAGHGVTIFGTGSGIPSIGQLAIIGNTILNVGTGGAKNGINILSPFKDAAITGNIVRAPTNLGIVMQGETAFIINDNKISECAGTYGIYVDIQGANVPGPGLIHGNFVSWAVPAGKVGCFCQNSSNATRISVIGNDFGSTGTPIAFGSGVVKSGSWANIGGNDAPVGSFTLAAAATTVVNNSNVIALCKIILVPTNAAAATLMGSAKALYISARTAGTSFTVATANAAAAAGTETFDYLISV